MHAILINLTFCVIIKYIFEELRYGSVAISFKDR